MAQDGGNGQGGVGRRRFLKVAGVLAAAAPFATRLAGLRAGEALPHSPAGFPQSVASGDPRPDRVLLWTRAPSADGRDTLLRLQVADDAGFTRLRVDRALTARAAADHCLRVRVRGLQPGRRYHYRFLRQDAGAWTSSRHGRTRTAATADVAAPLRFAVMSCQDYGGRWYNSLLPLLQDLERGGELDFILHLGDFIYETVGDASFQSVGGERSIRFDDIDGALPVEQGDRSFMAARSLDNYRQLHRTFRGDAVLQRLLEQAPLVAVWDDHEFSDDCWQDHGTYVDGLREEADAQRRRNAEQAYFEYMPVDIDTGSEDAHGAVPVEAEHLFPHTRLWRELRFGRDVQLLLLDYRSARPDHPVPEDAFPGALAYDAPTLVRLLPLTGIDPAQADGSLLPYLQPGHPEYRRVRGALLRALARAWRDAGLDAGQARRRARAAVAAPMALHVVRAVLERYNAAVPGLLRVRLPEARADLPRGLPWLALGKQGLFADIGSRYFVVQAAYALLLALRAVDVDHLVAPALGADQQAWLHAKLQGPRPCWRLLGSSVAMVPMVLDLADPALDAPEPMRRRFLLNVDQWDGFGDQRDALVQALDASGGALVFSGDIHAGFASQLGTRTSEFTVPAVSSTTLADIMRRSATADPHTADAGRRLVDALDTLLPGAEPRIRYAQTTRHGFGLVELDGEVGRVSFFEVPASLCRASRYGDPDAAIAEGRWVRFALDGRSGRMQPLPAEV
ncbi:MAG: alkaline phosphatase D family protein [Pseudoxanthomonas suwonensis]|nr:alkaline phosphatase D family protein [Pseudoxanthomonas suwonensis]